MNNFPHSKSDDKVETIFNTLLDCLATKIDLKEIHDKLDWIIEVTRPNLPNPEVRGGMSPFGNPAPNTGFFQPPTSPGVSPFNQHGNQTPGFFKDGNPCSEMFSNPREISPTMMQPPTNPGVNLFKNSKSFRGNPFNMLFPNPQTNNGVSSNEDRSHSPSGVVKTPTSHIVVVKPPLLQPGERYIQYEIDLLQINPRVTHHVKTPNGGFVNYYTASDGTVLSRVVFPPTSQQHTMPNSDKSNPLSGAFPGPQLTPDQVKIDVLEKRLVGLETLVDTLVVRVIPRLLEAVEKLSTKKTNVSEFKIEDEIDLYRELGERLNANRDKVNETKTSDKGEVKETVGKGEVKVTGVYGPFTSYNQPKMYLENKEEIDKIHEKLKDVENIDDLRSLDLMYLVLSYFYSAGDDGRASSKLLLKIRCGVTDIIQFLEERGLNSTYPETFNHISGRK